MNRVILRPLNKDGWAGIIRYKNCYEDISSYFTRTGARYTGLTEEESVKFAKVLGVETLNHSSSFWDNFHVRTMGKDIYLDLDDDMDLFKYTFLKGHKRVKNGVSDNKPGANFILINQESEAREANSFNRLKRKALRELDKLTTNEMKRALRLFGHSADTLDAEIVEAKLADIVEGNPEKFLNDWVNNTSRDTEYIIKTAVSKNILRKNKTVYKYGTDVIGYTIEEAIGYLDNPLHSDLKLNIIQQLDIKA